MSKRTPMAQRHQRPAGWRLGETPAPVDWRKALERLDGSYAPNTIVSYRADFSGFEAWCIAKGFKYLPASAEAVAGFIAAEMDRLKPTTLKRKLAGIRKIHYLLSMRDPTRDIEVDLVIRRARRLKPQRPAQALGLTAGLRNRLLAVCGDDLVGLRDRAGDGRHRLRYALSQKRTGFFAFRGYPAQPFWDGRPAYPQGQERSRGKRPCRSPYAQSLGGA